MEPAVFTLPERLDQAFVESFAAGLRDVADAPAIVLEGVAGNFCLGMDFSAASGGATWRGLEAFASCLRLLLNAPRPILAVVDGLALGGGLGLAAACDVVLASDRSRFGLPEALYGLAPAIIRPALLTRLSLQQVNYLLFTCVSRSADEAAALGLVDQIVAPEQLATVTREIVRQLSRARSATVAASRSWRAAEIERGLRAGIAETAAALCDDSVLAALRLADADPVEVPWRG